MGSPVDFNDVQIENNWPAPTPIRIFVGFDPKETVTWYTLHHSIQTRTSCLPHILPLNLRHLDKIFRRERDPKQSTDFTYTRFLVPWLCGYEGYALFMDCDMLCRADIAELWSKCDWQKAVKVVKHDYTPKTETKFFGAKQFAYPRKNWSSLMLFNNKRCTKLTLKYVNEASGAELHRFSWLSDEEIGEFPLEWNWLVGEYPYNKDAKMVHYTLGSPCLEQYKDCDYADEWRKEYEAMTWAKDRTLETTLRPNLKISER